jgi:phosphate transport system protein
MTSRRTCSSWQGLAEQAIQRAIEAYRVRDLSICDLVSRSELAINRLEREIDQAALDLLAMEQPMAIDLRFILSVIKINADLERVGDAAKSISERVRHMEKMAAGRSARRYPQDGCAGL